jgi:hypothetical protein
MRLEITHEWDAVIATFEHPRYEMYGGGQVFDGEAAVRAYFAASRTPFPDQGNEIIAISHADDTVLVEFWLTGTHFRAAQSRQSRYRTDGQELPHAHGRKLRVRAGQRTRSSASAPISIRPPCCANSGLDSKA